MADLADLNAHLRRCCLRARDRTCGGNAETVGTRFDRDRTAAGSLPARPFEACVLATGSVDKYQTVAFDGNRYSVPRRHAFRAVTVKGFIDQVEVVADHWVVAAHPRTYGSHERVLNPLHFWWCWSRTGRPRPRPGVPRLAPAADLRHPPRPPRTRPRPAGRRPPVHPRAATAR